MPLLALLSICLSLLTSLAWTILILGRALPWQATREWMFVFACMFLAAGLRWWHYWAGIQRFSVRPIGQLVAVLWGAGPSLFLTIAFLVAAYLLQGFYEVLMAPFFRMQFLAGAIAVTAILECLLDASATWLRDTGLAVSSALCRAIERRQSIVLWTSLTAVGILEGVARTSVIGDDLGQYIEAADALLARLPYPVHVPAPEYVAIGVTPIDPALPALPVLFAGSIALLGRNLAALGLALSVVKALFPIAVYVSCRALSCSKTVAYVVAILFTLFPIYQVHVLSAPEPDALFAILLLLAAALAAMAVRKMRWQYWAATGVAVALVANTRHEGLNFAVCILLPFLALQRPKKLYLALMFPFVGLLVPFSITSLSISGLLWPTYAGTLSPRNVEGNLALLRDRALPWYSQAIGLEAPILIALVAGFALTVGASVVLLWRTTYRPLVFMPLLGAGYVVTSLLIHPRVLNSASPLDVFRHWNSGIPYLVLSATYVAYLAGRAVVLRMPGTQGTVLALAGVVLLAGSLYYESERLARPELYFGGSASLMGTGYLLTDVIQHPVPLPPLDDRRSGEELRAEQAKPLEQFSLTVTNTPEPYYWSGLIFALLGLTYSSAPYFLRRVASRRHQPYELPWQAAQ